jgi:acetyl-CoA carboxylase biotin carboxyl carrier protein
VGIVTEPREERAAAKSAPAPEQAAPQQPAPEQAAPQQPAPEQPTPEPLAPEPSAIDVQDPSDASLLALVDRLAAMLDRTELTELEVEVGATGLVLRKPAAIEPVAAPTIVAAAAAGAAGPTAAEASGKDGAGPDAGPPARPSVKAPLTGIWYGSPAPGSAPYIVAGGEVAVGQVIGLIEAMKLFNEIKSDMAGRVIKVHAEGGKLVKAKQALIEVEPL